MATRNKPHGVPSSVMDPSILVPAIGQCFTKLDPRAMIRNPVMFVVEVVAILTTIILGRDIATNGEHLGFTIQIVVWLWITLLFANFAEAVAEGRGKAQAATLRKARTETMAKRLLPGSDGKYSPQGLYEPVRAPDVVPGEFILVEAGDIIPSDG